MAGTDTTSGLTEAVAILTAVQAQTAAVSAFKDEQIGFFTSKNNTTTVTGSGGAAVVVPTLAAMQTQINNISQSITVATAGQGYVYSQSIAAAVWNVYHGLNKHPSVTVVDSADTVIACGVEYVDLNNVIITSAYPFSGSAYFN